MQAAFGGSGGASDPLGGEALGPVNRPMTLCLTSREGVQQKNEGETKKVLKPWPDTGR